MNSIARMGAYLILAAATLAPRLTSAATEDEAAALVQAFKASFAWSARKEVLALIVDADARVAFHKILDGRPLRATDPEWRQHYINFQKEYTDAAIGALPPVTLSMQGEKLLKEALAKEFSSPDARAVLDLLDSGEFKAAVADPKFQLTWARCIGIYPRFHENSLLVIFSKEELQDLLASTELLSAQYPKAYAALMPLEPNKPIAMKRLSSIAASVSGAAALPAHERDAIAARVAAAVRGVVARWKPVVEARKPPPSPTSQWNDVTIMPADLESAKSPRFEDYPVALKYSGSPAQVRVASHPEARTWRARLREGASKGPNFADHYSIVAWGCGTDCMQFAIVDARNGSVYFPDSLSSLAFPNVHDKVLQDGVLRYRRDSALLVVVGMPNEDAPQWGVSYYVWNGSALTLVHRVKRKWYSDQQPNRPMQPTAASGG